MRDTVIVPQETGTKSGQICSRTLLNDKAKQDMNPSSKSYNL